MKKCLPFLLLLPFCAYTQTVLTNYNTGTSFSCITVDSNYNVWAGRSDGVYLLNKTDNPAATQFQSVAGTTNFNVQALAADIFFNLWVGHNGRGGNTAAGGGIERIFSNNPTIIKHYSPDRNAECFTYLARDGEATLNSAGLAVDVKNTVWSAQKYHDLTSSPDYILTPGSLSFKPASSATFFSKGTYEDYIAKRDPPELPYPAYTCNAPFTQTPQSRNVYSVACGAKEVWMSVAAYISKSLQSFPARIIKYDLDGNYTGLSFDFAAIGIPVGGIFNGLYVAPNGDVWVTMSAGKGFAVYRNSSWVYVNTSNGCIFPVAGTSINTNAIWGNKLGQVFIGTNQGLIVYRGTGPVNSNLSYTLYTKANFGLLSDQILGGVSEKNATQWIVTDNGIMSTNLGGNSPLNDKSFDYTMCTNKTTSVEIGKIESMIADPGVLSRKDYHSYQVETQVCSTTGPNGKNCNAEYVYKMIKNDASLTAPTPYDFPYDNLPPLLLLTGNLNKGLITNLVNQYLNNWNPVTGTESVKTIKQVIPSLVNAGTSNILDAAIAFVTTGAEFLLGRDDLMKIQTATNPHAVEACASYELENSPNFIINRSIYKTLIDFPFCGSGLESVQYDKVWIVPDDVGLTFKNYTQPGHFLYPGKVVRTVVEECGKVKIVTVGTGLNYCGNNLAGGQNAIGNIIAGSILFKNIDMRLRKAFEEAH